jgi:transmembrane sensor
MKKHHLNPEEKKFSFLGQLISAYFEKRKESDEVEETFESEKVYHQVLDNIQRKQHRIVVFRQGLRIAAAVALVLGLTTMYLVTKVKTVETIAAKGQTGFIQLADGTKVWLNADSKLSYPGQFKGDKREVSLTGEAYFEVAHQDKQPFIIHTGDVKTLVLGTSFNIRAYNHQVQVTVITGKVAVISPQKDTLYLTPDQGVTYKKERLQLTHVDSETSIGWKEGKMIYKGTEVEQVIEDVERKYNTVIVCNDKIRHCTITADFNNDELSTVLKVLAKLVNGTVTERDGHYYLEGNGCE